MSWSRSTLKRMLMIDQGIYLLEWILTIGYVKMIAGIFCGILLLNNLAVIPFMIFGKRIRIGIANSWLARMHQQTATVGETH